MTKDGRIIGAICLGQNVLLKFGVLQGRKAAGCGRIGKPAYYEAGAEPLQQAVYTDRRVVTAGRSIDNLAFAEAVLAVLAK
jgi:putative intracellular protease/amidase